MEIIPILKEELQLEFETTKRFFERYREDLSEYKPHPKNMTMSHLATHIAIIFSWPSVMLVTDSLDLSAGGEVEASTTTKALLDTATEGLENSLAALDNATEADLEPMWQLKFGDRVLAQWTRYGAIRHSLSQITHHRAQLGVYYRLNDIPLPNSYGPTADHPSFS
ncbi:DinB family protein [Parapedobacter sp. DT-150]|uniref:DinB family protein n=1 Tax=Parapedobacter sp. DT-150 TaxID=3396162 RepID=UPI003F1DA2D3